MGDEYLVVNPVNGLGNRLRSLASFGVLANELKLPLYVHWSSGVGFDDTLLSELIQSNDINLVGVEMWKTMKLMSFSISDHIEGVCENSVDSLHKNKRSYYIDNVLSGKHRQLSVTASNMLAWAFGSHEVERHINQFRAKYVQYLHSLKPSSLVLTKSREVLREFSDDVIGVHIRQGDATSDENIWNEMYSLDIVDGVFEYLDSIDSMIFLSTDDELILSLFKERYDKRLIYYNKKFAESVYGEPKKGQLDAMIDLYLLSRSTEVLATSPSSFAKLAVDMGGIKYKVVDSVMRKMRNAEKMRDIIIG